MDWLCPSSQLSPVSPPAAQPHVPSVSRLCSVQSWNLIKVDSLLSGIGQLGRIFTATAPTGFAAVWAGGATVLCSK